jgi:hypothetical protein
MPPLMFRPDSRPHMPARVNALTDRIAAVVERELHDHDREVLRCAYLTLAYRLRETR